MKLPLRWRMRRLLGELEYPLGPSMGPHFHAKQQPFVLFLMAWPYLLDMARRSSRPYLRWDCLDGPPVLMAHTALPE